MKTKLTNASQIWSAKPTADDWKEAIDYATVSLPWTFNRMQYSPTNHQKLNERLFNVMSGVLNQTILERILTKKGARCKKDWTNYRQSDIFDFKLDDNIYDVKTSLHFAQYDASNEREPFTPELLIKNRNYPGPEWRHFFPVGVPLSQITYDVKKTAYIDGIGSSKLDLKKRKPSSDVKGFWCSVPIGQAFNFFQTRPIISMRDEEGSGFYVKIRWKRFQRPLFSEEEEIELTVFGEWKGMKQTETFSMSPDSLHTTEKEFSSVTCVKVDRPEVLGPDSLEVGVVNNMNRFFARPKDPLININDDNFTWEIQRDDFIDLSIPKDYTIYWTGTIPIKEFASKFVNYPAYFINNQNNKGVNTIARVNTKFMEKLQIMDRKRAEAIEKGIDVPWPPLSQMVKGDSVNFGTLVSATRPGGMVIGGSCYLYPPYGLFDSMVYVLPKDLYTMDSLIR